MRKWESKQRTEEHCQTNYYEIPVISTWLKRHEYVCSIFIYVSIPSSNEILHLGQVTTTHCDRSKSKLLAQWPELSLRSNNQGKDIVCHKHTKIFQMLL